MALLPRRPRGLPVLLLLPALLAALALPAAAQEAAVTRRPTQLRDAPADSARQLAALPVQATVIRLAERQGPWVRVRVADGSTGWLHLFDLGTATAPAARGEGMGDALRGVAGLFGRPQQAQAGTSASGIRGLGAEDLARAQPDTAAVARLEALRQGEAEARSFASAAGLHPVQLAPFPAPAPAASPAGAGHPQAQ